MSQIPNAVAWWALSQSNGDDGDEDDKKPGPPKRFPWEDVMLITVILALGGLTAWFMFWK